MASTSDLVTDTENGGPPEPTTASATRDPGGTTLQCEALTDWPTNTKVFFVTGTPTIDSEGNPIINPTTLMLWSGVVSGTDIVDMVLTGSPGDTDLGNNIDDLVQMAPTSTFFHSLFEGFTEDHDTQGHHTPLHDTDGNLIIDLGPTASAVNNFKVSNAPTTTGPTLAVEGSDTNIPMNINTKGAGKLLSNAPVQTLNGNPVWQYLGSAQITSSITTASTSFTLATGLSVTATIPSGATAVKITFSGIVTSTSTLGGAFLGAKVGSSIINQIFTNPPGNSYNMNYTFVSVQTSPTPGSTTFSIQFASNNASYTTAIVASSTPSTVGDAGTPFILVECC